MQRYDKLSREATRFVVEAIQQALGLAAARVNERGEDLDHVERFPLIGQLFSTMRFFEVPMGDWAILGRRLEPDAVVEVIRGAIAALSLDGVKLAQEADRLLAHVSHSAGAISNVVPHVPSAPQWDRAVGAQLDVSSILRALEYPSRAIAITAAQLLATGLGGDVARESLRSTLNTGADLTLLLIGAIADDVWQANAFQVIHERLAENLSPGCGHLFEATARLASAREVDAARKRAAEGLFADDPAVAVGAAKALENMPIDGSSEFSTDLRRALDHWGKRGSWCERCDCKVTEGSCTQCSVVPPNPRARLVALLVRVDALTTEDLLGLAGDAWHDVRELINKSLAARAGEDDQTMRDLLDRIRNRTAPSGLLNAILDLPIEDLRRSSAFLIGLLSCENPVVRARIVSALGAGWLDHETAMYEAEQAASDPNPGVRSSAARAMRTLTQERERVP